MTPSEMDAAIAALVAALATGVETVRFSDGRSVTYRSAAEIGERLRALRQERAALEAGTTAPGFRMRSYPVVMLR